MNKTKKVSVILPIRNEERHISGCLDSILNQDYPGNKVEILAVDGMSEDRTREILGSYSKKYGNIKVIDNPGRITPKALNRGIKEARGEIIVRMDAHATYAPDYIRKCSECLKRTNADNVGGVREHKGNGFVGEAIALAEGSRFGTGGAKFRTAQREQFVDTVFPGAWPRKTFEKYGYFNERLTRNQDIEFNSRIRGNGGKIFLTPEIKSCYYCRSTLKDLWRQNFSNGLWNIKTIKIAPGSLSLRHFVPLFFVVGLLTGWLVKPIWFAVIASYILCNLFFSLKLACRSGSKYFVIMPIIFMILHLSYGFGSLVGILSLFTFCKRG